MQVLEKVLLGALYFIENKSEVIAIHKQGDLFEEKNYGNFIYPIISIFKYK